MDKVLDRWATLAVRPPYQNRYDLIRAIVERKSNDATAAAIPADRLPAIRQGTER